MKLRRSKRKKSYEEKSLDTKPHENSEPENLAAAAAPAPPMTLNADVDPKAASARAEMFAALHSEMELAKHAISERGHPVRRVPRKERTIRIMKRKALLRTDQLEMGIERDDDCEDEDDNIDLEENEDDKARGEKDSDVEKVASSNDKKRKHDQRKERHRRKRLRGPKIALEDVVTKSMPLDKDRRDLGIESQEDDGQAEEETDEERYAMLEKVQALSTNYLELELEENNNNEEGGEENEECGNSGDENDNSFSGVEDDDKEAGGLSSQKRESNIEKKSPKEGDQFRTPPQHKNSATLSKTQHAEKIDKNNASQSKTRVPKKKKIKGGGASTKRLMHRIREFTSYRLAECHGEAIGAHVRGMSETAVRKLREVAKAAPVAPQVYSSLGMVYLSMLDEVNKKMSENNRHTMSRLMETKQQENNTAEGSSESGAETYLTWNKRRLELAQKAYGSYHVAALLCKRDFVLWERSGDVAITITNIYTDIMTYVSQNPSAIELPVDDAETSDGVALFVDPEKMRSERKVWLEHALSAFIAADNLRPPGIDIPSKLARVHMLFGNYADALSILTDLINKAKGKSTRSKRSVGKKCARSEMEGSFPCWLLYADLMLRIGYECTRWNDGNSSVQNNIFRRWLRKHAMTFDWKERRLQALCLALEAAAGSVSCRELIEWMKTRKEDVTDTCENENKEMDDEPCKSTEGNEVENSTNTETDANGDGQNKEQKDINKNTSEPKASKSRDIKEGEPPIKCAYEQEREEIVEVNKVELNEFDMETKEMNLVVGSPVFRNRIATRRALVEKHRLAILDLAKRKMAKEKERKSMNAPNDETDSYHGSSLEPLPLSSSYATVIDIATSLMKQCIQLGLYQGGIFVIQSVLYYFRERVSRHERRIAKQRTLELRNRRGKGLIQIQFEHYDQLNLETDETDDDDDDVYISDEEDLNQSVNKPGLLEVLKKEILPSELIALHSICLLGTGGKDYLALTCLERIIQSNEMDLLDEDDNASEEISTELDNQWEIFRKSFTSTSSKTSVLASIANMMKDSDKKFILLHRLLRIFKSHLKVLDGARGLDHLLSNQNQFVKADILNIIFAASKILLDSARVELASVFKPGKDKTEISQRAIESSIYTLKIVTRFQHIMWNPNFSDWSIPLISIDMLEILSVAMSTAAQAADIFHERNLPDAIKIAFSKCRHIVSFICNAESAASRPITSFDFDNGRVSESWESFPISGDWQTEFHQAISLKAFNLCASCCASDFSGWEPGEFCLDLLRNRDNGNLFGLSLNGPTVVGLVSENIAKAISRQWQLMQHILPNLEVLRFELRLSDRKKTEWYQTVIKNFRKQDSSFKNISSFGEEHGIKIMLSFSKLCLISAEHSQGNEKDEFVKLAMSVLLPMTQFSIDKEIWDSKIGTKAINLAAESKVGYCLDENSQWLGHSSRVRAPPKIRKPQLAKPPRNITHFAHVIKIPLSLLLKEWKKIESTNEKSVSSADAEAAMKKLDDAMKNLRQSRTINALERSSIDVSVSLIDVASYAQCFNPFLCLQQAAIFASMGSKRGNNDESFRKLLPDERKCSSSEAMEVLGRADCLRAIHFLDEAQFLCSWVAKVCRLHRDREEPNLPWDARWRVIGVILYTLGASIDDTAAELSETGEDAPVLNQWDKIVEDEFDRGKSDARILVDMNSGQANTDEVDKEQVNPVEAENSGILVVDEEEEPIQIGDADSIGNVDENQVSASTNQASLINEIMLNCEAFWGENQGLMDQTNKDKRDDKDHPTRVTEIGDADSIDDDKFDELEGVSV